MRGAKARKNLSGRTKILVRTGARPQSRRTDNTGNMGISTRFQGAHQGANLGAHVRTPRFAPRSAHARSVDAAAWGTRSQRATFFFQAELTGRDAPDRSTGSFGRCAMRRCARADLIAQMAASIAMFAFTNHPNRPPWAGCTNRDMLGGSQCHCAWDEMA